MDYFGITKSLCENLWGTEGLEEKKIMLIEPSEQQSARDVPPPSSASASASACGGGGGVAVAVCKDKNSKYAVKWALNKLVFKGDKLTLIHVRPPVVYIPTPIGSFIPVSQLCSDAVNVYIEEVESETANMLNPFQQLCKNKEVHPEIVVLEDDNTPSAILKYISNSSISKLVMGASSRNAITRKIKGLDIPANVARKAPNYCTVYVISKGKLVSVHSNGSSGQDCDSYDESKNYSSLSSQESTVSREDTTSESNESNAFQLKHLLVQRNQALSCVKQNVQQSISNSAKRNPDVDESSIHNSLAGSMGEIRNGNEAVMYSESSMSSFSMSTDAIGEELTSFSIPDSEVENMDGLKKLETKANHGSDNLSHRNRAREQKMHGNDFEEQFMSKKNKTKVSPRSMPDIEAELERMKIEFQCIKEMNNGLIKKAIAKKCKAGSLNAWLMKESRTVEEAKMRENLAMEMSAEFKANSREVMENFGVARDATVNEVRQRRDAEVGAIRESYGRKRAQERKRAHNTLQSAEQRYRKYSIEEIESATNNFSESLKIGEGGYGPVYKCSLDHTAVAIKVLRADAARGRQEFQQEVEILSRIHHPNVVLLLGTCPERGCLVYEYMANGSLEDRLFRKGASPSLPWYERFRIASEIASALLFLHNTKPEPIVHRDLKPANILLDQNYVSKIGDVGLARLIPSAASSTFTEYKNTLLAGTFFYMDPEYQRTGVLRPKSDLYAFGIILLQLLTGKPPMGLTEKVENAIENGSVKEILDKFAGHWPFQEALDLAKLALKCTELRRRDRPDLETVVLPALQRFKDVANAHLQVRKAQRCIAPPSYFFCPILQVVMEDPYIAADGVTYEYKAIKAWLDKHNSPPMGNPKLCQKRLIPNISLRSAILEWRLGNDVLPISQLKLCNRKSRGRG